MTQIKMGFARKKKIKALLSMMSKQGYRLIPIAMPLVEMMNLFITDNELDFLLRMGRRLYSYQDGLVAGNMPDEKFQPFFDTLKRKGLIHIEHNCGVEEKYRLNAIVVGWYELAMYYIMGKPQEKAFSEKWNNHLKYFSKFNFYPLRNFQNIFLRHSLKPTQCTALINPEIIGKNKKRKISVNFALSPSKAKVYPTFYVDEIIEKYKDKNQIYVFPCVCRHGNMLIDSSCNFDIPKESCFWFGKMAKTYSEMGYGRNVSSEEAMAILKELRHKGAIHCVLHEKDDISLPVSFLCNCCWDCCSILKPYNMGAVALKYNACFSARVKEIEKCTGCGRCEKYCPTTAMKLKDGKAFVNTEKCIGCGQCAYQCRQDNIELYDNERTVYLPILKKSEIRIKE